MWLSHDKDPCTRRKWSLFILSLRPGLTQKTLNAKGLRGIVNVGDGKERGGPQQDFLKTHHPLNVPLITENVPLLQLSPNSTGPASLQALLYTVLSLDLAFSMSSLI